MTERFVALIPLRGGSKGIPDKNIRQIAGKPLCYWTISAAVESGIFDRVVVSTDSKRIREVVETCGLDVLVIDRPAHLASDTASTESVMEHLATQLDFDVLVTIQATSPLTGKDDLRHAWKKFREDNCDSMLSGVRTRRFFWSLDGRPLNYSPAERPRRQQFGGCFMENGAFYFTRKAILERDRCRLGGVIGIFEMDGDHAVEIDDENDWRAAERLLIARKPLQVVPQAWDVRLLVADVDGTLTDGGMYYGPDGEALKKFNTRDAKGLEMLRKAGIEVALMTAENSEIVVARAKKLGIRHCYIGVSEKAEKLQRLVAEMSIDLRQVAFVGDDVNDLECLRAVGYSACPNDAAAIVRNSVQYITDAAGGHGSVREFCDLILRQRDRK